MADNESQTPSAIRAACRSHFMAHLPALLGVFGDPEASHRDVREALRMLGDFGLGKADHSAVHVHAEGNVTLGVVHLPALGTGRDPAEAAEEHVDPRELVIAPNGAKAKALPAKELED